MPDEVMKLVEQRLQWISEARNDENADLDTICTYADQALTAIKSRPGPSEEAVDAVASQLAFNAAHLVAEDDKDDALLMVEVARRMMNDAAKALRAARAALSAIPHTGGVKIKALEWGEYKALGNGRKLVAHDCFGNEFARLDLVGQSFSTIEIFKREKQAAYEKRIRSTLSGD